jgi:hypothetical protein
MPDNKKPDYIVEERVRFFKAADEIIRLINDENATMTWLAGGIPDGSADDEAALRDIAEDDEGSNEISSLFCRLVVRYGIGNCAFCGHLAGAAKKKKEDK